MSAVPAGFTGHARDALKLQCIPDPKVRIGPFRILQRTDGMFVVFDPRRPLGASCDDRSFVTLDAAKAGAMGLCDREGVPYAQAKKPTTYDADAEAFAAMKRAMENGFATHGPAYSPEELAALRREEARGVADGGRRT